MKHLPIRWLACAGLAGMLALPHIGMAATPGTLRWVAKLSDGKNTDACREKVALAIDDDGRVYARTNGVNEIFALDAPTSGTHARVAWQIRAPFGAACAPGPAHLAARGDMLFAAYPGMLGALRLPPGKAPVKAWTYAYAPSSKVFAQPVIAKEVIHLSAREWRPADGDHAALDRLATATGVRQWTLPVDAATPDTPDSKLVHLRWSDDDDQLYLAGNFGLANTTSATGAAPQPLTERALRSFTLSTDNTAYAFERGIKPEEHAGRLVVLHKDGTRGFQVEKTIELPAADGEAQDASKLIVGQDGMVYVTIYPKHKSRAPRVYKFDTENGTVVWSYTLPATPNFASWEYDDDEIFVNATPVLGDDGTVYVSAVDNYRTLQLHAIDADTGHSRWIYSHPAIYPIAGKPPGDYITRLTAPLLGSDDGTVYVGAVIENNSSASGAARYKRQALVLAIHGEGGALAMAPWPAEYGDWGNTNMPAWHFSPVRRQ